MKCGPLAILVLLSIAGVAEADTPVIVTGARADWTWRCGTSSATAMSCYLYPYPVKAFSVHLTGGRDLCGPDIQATLTEPEQFNMTMRIDGSSPEKITQLAPASYGAVLRMLAGKHVVTDYVVPFTAHREIVDVSLAGFREAYCDAFDYFEKHGSIMQPSDWRLERKRMPVAVFPGCQQNGEGFGVSLRKAEP